MDVPSKAKSLFIQELATYLDLMKSNKLSMQEVRSHTHRLKGGAGMLQLLEIREVLHQIQHASEKEQPFDEHLLDLIRLHEKLS
jgi:HPt (histidine-containing phosphotransfer) domain-containing protein